MAATFARLPCKVLWRLTLEEVPDEAAMAQLGLGNNTKARFFKAHVHGQACCQAGDHFDITAVSVRRS